MGSSIFVPDNLRTAGAGLRRGLTNSSQLEVLERKDFIRIWSSIAYLFPGLHPDSFEAEESSWPRVLHRFAFEAWHRAKEGNLTSGELYPSDAQWAGLFDRLSQPTAEESMRRSKISMRPSS